MIGLGTLSKMNGVSVEIFLTEVVLITFVIQLTTRFVKSNLKNLCLTVVLTSLCCVIVSLFWTRSVQDVFLFNIAGLLPVFAIAILDKASH